MRPFRRHRHAELDARVERAREHAEAAQAEAELSERRYESVRQYVVRPLREARDRNSFAEMIRASLTAGHGNGS